VGGVILYSDFEFEDTNKGTTSSVNTEDDATYGLQTFVDIGFAKSGQWGMSFGLKWMDTELDVDGEELSIDPVIVSVMGKFHF
jgi:hypothetical protein